MLCLKFSAYIAVGTICALSRYYMYYNSTISTTTPSTKVPNLVSTVAIACRPSPAKDGTMALCVAGVARSNFRPVVNRCSRSQLGDDKDYFGPDSPFESFASPRPMRHPKGGYCMPSLLCDCCSRRGVSPTTRRPDHAPLRRRTHVCRLLASVV